jgi:hypothetical protein
MPEFDKKISGLRQRPGDGLISSLRRLTDHLIFTSETDAPVEVIQGGSVSTVSPANVLKQFRDDRSAEPVEEISFDEFFDRMVTIREWYSDQGRDRAFRYAQLRDLLTNSLRDLKVLRVGRVQIEIYVVGLNKENEMVGIKTNAVET